MNIDNRREVGIVEESRATPSKRRRLLPLIDLRNPECVSHLSCKESVGPSETSQVMEFSGSASVGSGRRSRPALTDLTKSGFCGILECGEPLEHSKVATLGHVQVLTKGISDPKDGSVSRFPRLDQCAHFHYEFVELPSLQVVLVNEDLKPLSQSMTREDVENKSLLVQVTSLGRTWVVRRTYDNFRFLDKQLHRCCYDRKISQLQELPPEENLPREEELNCVESLVEKYLSRLSYIAGSLITCGPVLGWLELDNRGHRLIVTDDSDINTPAVAAAYVVKRYSAQASDEISFEVGDMISVIDMPPPEESIWWRGKRGFQVGFFPCECVQVIEGKVPQGIQPHALALPAKRSACHAHAHSSLHAVHSFSGTQEPMKPVLRKHGKLIAFFRSFILSRPPRPWLKRSGILRERVFGCDLAEHLLNSGHDIPMVLKCCAEFIETHGTVDGIYRLSGITSNIQKLRNAFDEERVPALYEDESILQDIHCVSSVLKMYFRELPNPLLTYQLYAKFSQAVIQEEGVRLLHVRDVVQQLPPPHFRTLEYLIRHLARVASFSNTTGMTPKNIAIVWAPNLLRSKDLERGGVAALQDVGTQAVVTEYLVRYVDLIFNDKIPNFSPSSLALRDCNDKLPRPKSLAISTPVKLLSIDEARNRSLAAIKSDQNYIDVGGGPNSLPKTYHTVIDVQNRKGGSLKQKKSPLGWKTFFWKNKHHQQKKNHSVKNNSNISDVNEGDEQPSKRLKSAKSVESLSSNGPQLQSIDNQQIPAPETNSLRNMPFMEKERSLSSLSSPSSSRTHSRSLSLDSYFNVLAKRPPRNYLIESEISTSPKFDVELTELNIEFKLSESDDRLFSEDDTLQSTSMDTTSRNTLNAEGVSLRSAKSPSYRGRVSRPLKRNLFRSSSEDFKCASLNATEAGVPSKHYRSSGNLPKYARLHSNSKRYVAQCDNSEVRSINTSDHDKSPSRGSFDSALIEPDLLERITHMRTYSTEEMESVESLSAEPFPEVENPKAMLLKPTIQASVDEEELPELNTPDVDEDMFPIPVEAVPLNILLPAVEVEVHFQIKADCPSNRNIASSLVSGQTSPSYVSGMDFDMSIPPTAMLSPETPQSELTFGDIQYHPLSDTTEPSTPSDNLLFIANQPNVTSPTVTCDSLSSQYQNLVPSPSPDVETPMTTDKNSQTQFPSVVEYETLCDYSPETAENQGHPQISMDDSILQDVTTIEESNYYENIEHREDGEFIVKSDDPPEYENCEFVGGVALAGTHSAAIEDQSVYQQVKYLRRSIQEVNEILNEPSPQLTERRKSITQMTIHFSKPAVASENNFQVRRDYNESGTMKDFDQETPSSTSIIKEIFSLTEVQSPNVEPILPQQEELGIDDTIFSNTPKPNQNSVGDIIALSEANSNIAEVSPRQSIVVLRRNPNDILEDNRSIEHFRSSDIAASNKPYAISCPVRSSDIIEPIQPIPLPRTTINPLVKRAKGTRSLTPPGHESDSFECPSTSLPADLAITSSHDVYRTKTWPLPPIDQQRSMSCCDDGEDDSQKRKRIEKYKEERRSFLRRNYHPSSFKGEKDEMLQRLKQKAASHFKAPGDETRTDKDINSLLETEGCLQVPKVLEVCSVLPIDGHVDIAPLLLQDGISSKIIKCRKVSPFESTMKNISAGESHPSRALPKPEMNKKNCTEKEEVTVRERVAIWAQQGTYDAPKLKSVCTKDPLPKSSHIVIQGVKDRGVLPHIYKNGVDNLHRPCVKSQSSDAIARSIPSVLPLKSEIASRRSSDGGRILPAGPVVLKATRKLSPFDPTKIPGTIGQDKIRAIAAQFEPEIKPKSYLRQISK